AEPLDVGLDRVDVLHLLLLGVGVVEAEVAAPAVLRGDAEVEADRLGVADVEVAIGLRGEPRQDPPAVLPGAVVLVDDVADDWGAGRPRSVVTWALVTGHSPLLYRRRRHPTPVEQEGVAVHRLGHGAAHE